MNSTTKSKFLVVLTLVGLYTAQALASGGGQNMVVVVNSDDEQAVRIAAAYQQTRNIPASNFVFVSLKSIAGTYRDGMRIATMTTDQRNTILTTVKTALNNRGLTGHVDYISIVGLPGAVKADTTAAQATTHEFTNLTQFVNGSTATASSSELAIHNWATLINGSTPPAINSIPALHHSTVYDYYGNKYQYYTTGILANTGQFGSSPQGVIANLQRTAAADGQKPQGTIYFEENDDRRSNAREPQWPKVKAGLDARGIPYVESRNTPGNTPLNRSDVRGAVVGHSNWTLPNGSTYLPGSYADSLTSHGANFPDHSQSKATDFITAGAAGSSGTVVEPGLVTSKFPHGYIHLMIADGLTLGEAHMRSVWHASQTSFIGDQLAQPYADVPRVAIDSGPADKSTVSGAVSLNTTATLVGATIATAITKTQLWIDGKLAQEQAGGNGSFNLNTTTLSDGYHEIRVVAINNALAESQGQTLRSVIVNNQGRNVSTATSSVVVSDTAAASIGVSSAVGTGGAIVARIEMRNLGRTVGTLAAASGSVSVDSTKLAYGANVLIPVAIFSDGKEVAGAPVTLTRNPTVLVGKAATPAAARAAGIKVEYFLGKGGKYIPESDFTGTPDITQVSSALLFRTQGTTGEDYLEKARYIDHSTTTIDKLAVRFSGLFALGAAEAGEYTFSLPGTNDSAELRIDGISIMQINNVHWNLGSAYDVSRSLFLGESEHTFELLTANTVTSDHAANFNVAAYVRGENGVTRLVDDSFLYQVVPEPAGVGVFLLGAAALLRRRRTV